MPRNTVADCPVFVKYIPPAAPSEARPRLRRPARHGLLAPRPPLPSIGNCLSGTTGYVGPLSSPAALTPEKSHAPPLPLDPLAYALVPHGSRV